MKCGFCANYVTGLDECKFCKFEYEYSVVNDDWDIFNLDENDGWLHEQVLNRLNAKGVDCVFADVWFDLNMGFLIGCFESSDRVASVLNLHSECVYGGLDNGLVLLNLFQEKFVRGLL